MQALRDGITSSPIAASPSRSAHGLGPDSSSFLKSPTPAQRSPQSIQHRKRPSEDHTGFVNGLGREMKLRKIDKDELRRHVEFTAVQHRLWISARLLKVSEHQEAMVAPETIFELPKRLKSKIDKQVIIALLDPTIHAYIEPETDLNGNGPAAVLYRFVKATPSWGFTAAMAAETSKVDVLVAYIREKFTRRRSVIKGVIDDSISGDTAKGVQPFDIIDLCKAVKNLLSKTHNVILTREHCVRFAFIRMIAAMNPPPPVKQFWKVVDHELNATRQMNQVKQHKFLAKILADDRKKYGDNEEIETLQAQENGANHPTASDNNENNNASGDADGPGGHEGGGNTDEDE